MDNQVVVISGNLTTKILDDWPRAIFHHTNAFFSPSYDFSIIELRFYNSSLNDYMGTLGLNHPELIAPFDRLDWNFTSNNNGYSSSKGQYVSTTHNAVINLFDPIDLEPVVEDWGTIEVTFEISQQNSIHGNLHPKYAVLSNHYMDIAISISVLQGNEFYSIALIENFQGGGATHLARIYRSVHSGTNYSAEVNTRVNELSDPSTGLTKIYPDLGDWQIASLSTKSGAEQSLCAWNRSTVESWGGNQQISTSDWFYGTTGTSLSLYSVQYPGGETDSIVLQQSLSLIEEGFDRPIKNVLLDSLPFLIGLSILIPSIILSYRFARIRRASRITFIPQDADAKEEAGEIKPK